jgi:hypothetical protein
VSWGTGNAVVVICYEPSHGLDRALDRQDDDVPRPWARMRFILPQLADIRLRSGRPGEPSNRFREQPQHELRWDVNHSGTSAMSTRLQVVSV